MHEESLKAYLIRKTKKKGISCSQDQEETEKFSYKENIFLKKISINSRLVCLNFY